MLEAKVGQLRKPRLWEGAEGFQTLTICTCLTVLWLRCFLTDACRSLFHSGEGGPVDPLPDVPRPVVTPAASELGFAAEDATEVAARAVAAAAAAAEAEAAARAAAAGAPGRADAIRAPSSADLSVPSVLLLLRL